MRSIVTVVVCASLLQVIWLSVSNGKSTDCTDLQLRSECCSSDNACVFVKCTENGEQVKGCFDNTEAANCDEAAEAVDICGVETTTKAESGDVTAEAASKNASADAETTQSGENEAAGGETTKAPKNKTTDEQTTQASKEETTGAESSDKPTDEAAVDCSSYNSDKTECCAAGNSSACIFFNCTDGKGKLSGTVCAAADANPVCSEEEDTPGANVCTVEPPAGTEEPPAVDCASYSTDQAACCSAGNSTACIFFNCTDGEGTLTGTVCAAADVTPACANEGETASDNKCEGSSAMTEDPNQSPSTGGGGGQEFDAASFIGGIVLCAGVLAIGYFGLKFYRSRQDRNYQSM